MSDQKTPAPLVLDDDERATILAALRFYQENGLGNPSNRSREIHWIATNGGELISLDAGGIDRLCVAVNFGDKVAPPDERWRVKVRGSGISRADAVLVVDAPSESEARKRAVDAARKPGTPWVWSKVALVDGTIQPVDVQKEADANG